MWIVRGAGSLPTFPPSERKGQSMTEHLSNRPEDVLTSFGDWDIWTAQDEPMYSTLTGETGGITFDLYTATGDQSYRVVWGWARAIEFHKALGELIEKGGAQLQGN